MAWSAITSVVTYSAGNAVSIPHAASEPIKVRLRHPGTGSDGIVTLYGSAGEVIQTATVSATNPISEVEFRTSSQTINYSTDRAFDAPGLTIEPMGIPMFKTDGLSVSSSLPIAAPNSISSFVPGQTAGVPDTASLAVVAGVSQRVALPTGTVFRLDWSGFGPFAFRFGSVSAVAVTSDFPGNVGLPQYFAKPAGATHIAVYGIGGGTLIVSGGSQP